MIELLTIIRRKYRIADYFFPLVICLCAITVVGILVIGSANESYRNKQILGLVLGLFVMAVVSLIDYELILKFHWLIYAVIIFVLILVLVFGYTTGGATRWIDLKVIRFQPSELAKILMILFLAHYLTSHKEDMNKARQIIKTLVLIFIPVVLIQKEPDLSTSIVFVLVCLTLFFLSGLSAKVVAVAMAVGIPTMAVGWHLILTKGEQILNTYQYLRIMGWLYPEEYPNIAYQQQNAITAVGSGMLFGKGLYNTDVDSAKNGNFISEPQTDFIFAVTGEELGFVGGCVVIGLLLLICLFCMYIGFKAKDEKGSLIAYGMGLLIGFQTFINICVVTGLFPNTGLPLPFVSYGLTSLVTLFFGMGIVLNVGLQRERH